MADVQTSSAAPRPCLAALRKPRMPVCTFFLPLHAEPERLSSIEDVCWRVDHWGFKPTRVQGPQGPQFNCQSPPQHHSYSRKFA